MGVLAGTHQFDDSSRVMSHQSANRCVVGCVSVVVSSCGLVCGHQQISLLSCTPLRLVRHAWSALETFVDQLLFVRPIARACASSAAPLRVQGRLRDRERGLVVERFLREKVSRRESVILRGTFSGTVVSGSVAVCPGIRIVCLVRVHECVLCSRPRSSP